LVPRFWHDRFLGERPPAGAGERPLDEVAAKIACYIRQLQPQVVLTFDPIGGYRHPDHIAVHQATVSAFHTAGDPEAFPCEFPAYQPQKLYFHTFPRRMLRWAVRLMPLFGKDPHRFGLNGDVDLVPLAEVDFPVHARINYKEVLDLKEAASACHASQGSMGASSGLMRFAFRRFSGIDQFMRAFPLPEPGLKERDLFAGVQLDTALIPTDVEEIQQ
jgi:LmbE family N-acetylglucosaminyl deacetylase